MTRRDHSDRRSSRKHNSSASRHRSSGHVDHPRASDPEFQPVTVDLRSRDDDQSHSRYRSAASSSATRTSLRTDSNPLGYVPNYPYLDPEEKVPDLRFDISDASSSTVFHDDSPPRSHDRPHNGYSSRSSYHDGGHRSHVPSSISRTSSTPSWAHDRNTSDSRHGLEDLSQYQELERYRREDIPQRGYHGYEDDYVHERPRQPPIPRDQYHQRRRDENDNKRISTRAEKRYPRNDPHCPFGHTSNGPFW